MLRFSDSNIQLCFIWRFIPVNRQTGLVGSTKAQTVFIWGKKVKYTARNEQNSKRIPALESQLLITLPLESLNCSSQKQNYTKLRYRNFINLNGMCRGRGCASKAHPSTHGGPGEPAGTNSGSPSGQFPVPSHRRSPLVPREPRCGFPELPARASPSRKRVCSHVPS